MPSDRMRQINMALRDYFAAAINRVVELPTGTVVSVIRVQTTSDLHNSTVFLSVVPDAMVGSTMKRLKKQSHEIFTEVVEHITFKSIPKFRLVLDDTERKASQIEELLDSIKEK